MTLPLNEISPQLSNAAFSFRPNETSESQYDRFSRNICCIQNSATPLSWVDFKKKCELGYRRFNGANLDSLIIQSQMRKLGLSNIINNRSESSLNIQSQENVVLNAKSSKILSKAVQDVEPGKFISFSGILNRNTGSIDLLPNIPREKQQDSGYLKQFKQQPVNDYEPVKFPDNPQNLISKDLKKIHCDQFQFPAYQPNVNRIPEHIKHLYLNQNNGHFMEKLGLNRSRHFLGFTLNVVNDMRNGKAFVLDGKSQSLNGLQLCLDQRWDLQPKEGSELSPQIALKIIRASVQLSGQSDGIPDKSE